MDVHDRGIQVRSEAIGMLKVGIALINVARELQVTIRIVKNMVFLWKIHWFSWRSSQFQEEIHLNTNQSCSSKIKTINRYKWNEVKYMENTVFSM